MDIKPVKSTYEHDGLKIELTILEHEIDTVISAMESVIRGAGFSFEGQLCIDDFEVDTELEEGEEWKD